MTDERKISEAFSLVVDYATKQGWIPIGDRSFVVGGFEIRVNGTKEDVDGIPPFHARAIAKDYIGMMLFHPFGGTVGGYRGTEEDFINSMKLALEA